VTDIITSKFISNESSRFSTRYK